MDSKMQHPFIVEQNDLMGILSKKKSDENVILHKGYAFCFR